MVRAASFLFFTLYFHFSKLRDLRRPLPILHLHSSAFAARDENTGKKHTGGKTTSVDAGVIEPRVPLMDLIHCFSPRQ